MWIIRLSSLLLTLPLALAGCGGSDGPRGEINPLAGQYRGTFERAESDFFAADNGTFELRVAGDGTVSGTVASFVYGESTRLTGTIAGSVEIDLHASFPSNDGTPFERNLNFVGTLPDDNGRLRGTLFDERNGQPYPVLIDLRRR